VTKTRGTVETSSGKNAAHETQYSGGRELAYSARESGPGGWERISAGGQLCPGLIPLTPVRARRAHGAQPLLPT
jgi:hypothetical protein